MWSDKLHTVGLIGRERKALNSCQKLSVIVNYLILISVWILVFKIAEEGRERWPTPIHPFLIKPGGNEANVNQYDSLALEASAISARSNQKEHIPTSSPNMVKQQTFQHSWILSRKGRSPELTSQTENCLPGSVQRLKADEFSICNHVISYESLKSMKSTLSLVFKASKPWDNSSQNST